jgi:hypothetical protein
VNKWSLHALFLAGGILIGHLWSTPNSSQMASLIAAEKENFVKDSSVHQKSAECRFEMAEEFYAAADEEDFETSSKREARLREQQRADETTSEDRLASDSKSRLSGDDFEWPKHEDELEKSYNNREVDSFLEKVEIPNLYSSLRFAKVASRDEFKKIQGVFSGRINFLKQSNFVWDVSVEIAMVNIDGKPMTRTMVEIFEDGRSVSRIEEEGVPHQLVTFPGKSQSFVLTSEKRASYLQLYLVRDKLVGNFYENHNNGRYKKTGTVVLNRIYNKIFKKEGMGRTVDD